MVHIQSEVIQAAVPGLEFRWGLMLMFTVLIFPGGRQADAVLLSASGDRLRFAVSGRSDATELRNIRGRWMNERGEQVELGALIAMDRSAEALPAVRTRAAGWPS